MKRFSDLKIKTKLILCFLIVSLFAGIVGIIGISNMKDINESAGSMYSDNLVPINQLGTIMLNTQNARNALILMLYDKDPSKLSERENIIKQLVADNNVIYAEYEKTIIDKRESAAYEVLKSDRTVYRDLRDRILKLISDGKTSEAFAQLPAMEAARQKTDEDIQKLIDINKTLADEANKQNEASFKTESMIMTIIILSAIAVSIGFSFIIALFISKPIGKLVEVSDKLALGDIDVHVESTTKDEIGTLMASFSRMVANIKEQAEEVNKIAAGDLNVEVKIKSDKDILSKSVKLVVDTLRNLIAEMQHMSKEHDAGDIEVFVAEDKFNGAFKTMAQGVNNMVKGHILVKKKAMACVEEFAKGNFNANLEKFPGKKAFINDSIEALRKNLKDVNTEIKKLIIASNEGKLSERADTKIFAGDWAELIKGLNGLIDAIIEPVQEAAGILDEMAKGNLQVSVKGSYKGDHAKIKEALNDTIATLSSYVTEISGLLAEMANGNLVVGINREYRGDFTEIKNSLNNIIKAFNDVLNDINNAASQVASGSRQVSDSAQALSQGSTEQASSIEELSASIEEIAAQTRQNAVNANQANELAIAAKEGAVAGNEQMKEMLMAMKDINEASANISKIIKVIDEIAFQTNILALNAAVEAARAGQHGKGFAVVAEEVRNLAARSANAAKETTVLIEGSIKKVESGTKLASDTAYALNRIVEGVTKATLLVGEIATASNEQASGIAQVNQGIMQVSQVVQTNSATSEESAAASEELSSQAELLKEMVSKFKLKKGGSAANSLNELNPEVMRMLEDITSNKRINFDIHGARGETAPLRTKIILSDKEFGKY